MAGTQDRKKLRPKKQLAGIEKAATGIRGLDQITGGGLPRGRTTLVKGGPGCGKTVMAIQFIVNGIEKHNEPGVYMAFEETAEDLAVNVASQGVDLAALIERKMLVIDHVHVDRSEIEYTGAYDLEGLFVRLDSAISRIGAKRVVLDTVEVLLGGLPDHAILRSEMSRLFRWLKNRGVTTIATGETTEAEPVQNQLDEFVSDCVVALDHQLQGDILTRHLRVVKYRGSKHGTNSYPFLIDEGGITVTPITSIGLDHSAPMTRISTGLPSLDAMLGSKGVYQGSSTLVTGTAGTGKTSIAAHFVNAACERGERALYFAFEESPSQIIRNMRSIGLDLSKWVEKNLLQFHAVRPTLYGLEMHLTESYKYITEFRPSVVVVDPISNLITIGAEWEANSMVRRLVDFVKCEQVTALFTDLSSTDVAPARIEIGISSLMDTWIVIKNSERNGELNRTLRVLKSRGVAHSAQVREVMITDHGIELADVYLGPEGILTGSAKTLQRWREGKEVVELEDVRKRRQEASERRREALQAKIQAMEAQFEAEQADLRFAGSAETDLLASKVDERQRLALTRTQQGSGGNGKGEKNGDKKDRRTQKRK